MAQSIQHRRRPAGGPGAIVTITALAALFAVCAAAGIAFSKIDGRIAAIWVPNALAVVVLLWRRDLPLAPTVGALFACNVIVDWALGDSLARAVGFSLANAAEISLAAYLLRRRCPNGVDPQRFGPIQEFLLWAGLVAPLVSTLIAALVELALSPANVWQTIVRWMLADAIGMMLVGTCLLIFVDSADRRRLPTRREALDWAALTLAGSSVVAMVFVQTSYPLLFMVAPVVLIHAFRHGTLGAAVSTVKIAIVAIAATALDYGPIASLVDGAWAKIIVLEVFLLTVLLMGVPVAALLQEKRTALIDLTEREFQLSLLTDNATDAVMAFDWRGRCCFATAAAERLYQCPRHLLIGRPFRDLIDPADLEDVRKAAGQLLQTDEIQTVTYRRPSALGDGAPVFLAARCRRLTGDGTDRIAVVASVRDVTDRVALERQLSAAVVKAEQAAEAKARFLANMSHEIRTPMNGVLGFSELLLETPLDANQRRKIGLIVESGRSMMRILNDILDLSKIESGTVQIASEPLNLAHLLDSCVTLNRALAEQKGLEIGYRLDPELPELVLGDQLRVRQILLNLIGNAIKFTEHGKIRITARKVEDRMQLGVSDTGIGIAPEHLATIFEPFEQGPGDTAQRFGGTGLGLSISSNLARMMAGSLSVNSIPGQGSTFILELPLVAQAERRCRAPQGPLLGSFGAAVNDERILVVDDHDINRELVFEMLTGLGYRVVLAEDGLEAISAVREAARQDRMFNLVLMDLQMPNCDGCAATRAIRVAGYSPQALPIVALTATTFPEDISAAMEAGMQDHLAKPVSFEGLRQVANRWALHETPASAPPQGSTSQAVQSDERLILLWLNDRTQALSQVEKFVAGEQGPSARQELARVMHQITGTAAQFGEGQLGERAAEIEAALRQDAPPQVVTTLARAMLTMAAPC